MTTKINTVIDIREYRDQRRASERRKQNEEFAAMVISRWSDGGPAGGQALFSAIVAKAMHGDVTPERAAVLLPVLLEVLDEMEGGASDVER